MTTATSTCLDKEEDRFHPSYASDDADLVLISKDGVKFRVHSTVLKIASHVFRDMLQTAVKTEEPIYMDDESSDLEMILNAIYPNGCSLKFNFESFQSLWHSLNIADKYSIDKIQKDLKSLLEYKAFLTSHALEGYVLACRFGWENLLQDSSTATLAVDLRSTESREVMKHLEGIHLLRLYSLHEKRRRLLTDSVKIENVEEDNDENVTMAAIRLSASYRHLSLDTTRIAAIKHFIAAEMEKCSDGSTLFNASFWEDKGFKEHMSAWNLLFIKEEIQRIFNTLPKKIADIT